MTHAEPVGVVRLSIQSAHIIPWSKLRGGSPDPFVGISINDGDELVMRTRHQSHDFEPTWMETKYVVVYSLKDTLMLRLYDRHEHRRHVLLGEARLEISRFGNELEGQHLSLIKDEKQRGELLVSVAYHPTVDSREVAEFCKNDCIRSYVFSLPLQAWGIVTLGILGGRRLDGSNSMARVSLGADGAFKCQTDWQMNTNEPAWGYWQSFYWANDRSACRISVEIVDKEHDEIGELVLSLDDLMEGNSGGVEWWPLSGCRSGELN